MRILLLCLCLISASAASAQTEPDHILLETSRGDILIQLNRQRAPLTTAHIVERVRDGHYEGLIFHRVIEDFVIQTGGRTPLLDSRDAPGSVVNESGNGLRNTRGSVALARGDDPHSGSAQFYINLSRNEQLDPRPSRWGYAVFGHVAVGMPVVDEIGAIPTRSRDGLDDVPNENVVIESARLMTIDEALDWQEEQDRTHNDNGDEAE